MKHQYLNEDHRKSSLAAQAEVAEMMKHPHPAEEKVALCLANREKLGLLGRK